MVTNDFFDLRRCGARWPFNFSPITEFLVPLSKDHERLETKLT